MKRIISLIAAIILVFTLAVPAYAAKPSITLSVKRYDTAQKAYVKTNGKAINGDLLLVEIGVSGTLPSIGAMRLKLLYNSAIADYIDGGEFLYINSGTPLVKNKISDSNAEQSYTLATIGGDGNSSGTAVAENFSGTVVAYLFRCKSTGVCRFTATFEEIYDKNYKNISIDKKQTSFVTVSRWEVPDLPLFSALKDIKYPDSKTAIEAADKAYEKLSSTEQTRFKLNFPDEYNYYSSAWKRYYDLADAAAEAAIMAEIDLLLNSEDYLKIKDLTADDINETNYESAVSSYNKYKKLSNSAKKRVSDAVKNKINSLYAPAAEIVERIKRQKSADEDAELFNSIYNNLKDLDDVAVRSGAESDLFLDQIRSATADIESMDIDIMSPDYKNQMQEWKKKLAHYNELIEDELIKRGISQKLLEEINAFTSKWSKVLRLHMLNVKISDKSAIEMMLEDYENLSDAAKEQLSSSYNSAKQLLRIIGAVKDSNNNTNSNTFIDSNNSPQQNTENIGQTTGSNNVLTVETVKKIFVEGDIAPVVKIFAVITAVSVLSIFFPIGVQLIHQIKKQKEEKE